MSASANSLYFGDNLEILRNEIKSESVEGNHCNTAIATASQLRTGRQQLLVEDMRNEAQQALDDLFNEKLIPFKLTAYIVRAQEDGIYTVKDGIYNVQFFDSRFHELSVCWKEGQSFKNIIRAAVLRMTQNPYAASSSLNVHTWPVRPDSIAGVHRMVE